MTITKFFILECLQQKKKETLKDYGSKSGNGEGRGDEEQKY